LVAAAEGGGRVELEAALAAAELRPAGPERLDPAMGGIGPNKATQQAFEAAAAALASELTGDEIAGRLAKATTTRTKAALEAAIQDAIAHDPNLAVMLSMTLLSSSSTGDRVLSRKASLCEGGGASMSRTSSMRKVNDDNSKLFKVAGRTVVVPPRFRAQETAQIAQALLLQMAKEDEAVLILDAAIVARSQFDLESAVSFACGSQSPVSEPNPGLVASLADAERLLVQLMREANVVTSLKEAVALRDREELQKALDSAVNVFGEDGSAGLRAFDREPCTAEAQALLDKLTFEKEMVVAVAMAIGKQDRALLNAALDRAEAAGCQHPTLLQAIQLRDALIAKFGALATAVGARDGLQLVKVCARGASSQRLLI
jgi:hypothetical protein